VRPGAMSGSGPNLAGVATTREAGHYHHLLTRARLSSLTSEGVSYGGLQRSGLLRNVQGAPRPVMKKVQIRRFGRPEEVAECVECPDVGEPASDEVVFEVLAFPINPADISFCQGRYRLKPPLPATPGAEAVGRVTSIGTSVTGIKVRDLVTHLDRENWAQHRRVKADRVIALPRDTDVLQAAMIRINPPTAMLLVSDLVASLGPNDWIIQNAANSSVGKLVILFAKEKGVRTVNVVRRVEVFEQLYKNGADACIVDSPDLPTTVAGLTKGAPVRLGIDAVGGSATARIASCVADSGTVCAYGALSGENLVMPTSELVFRGIDFKGFLLGRHLEKRPATEINQIYSDIAESMRAGKLSVPVEKIYSIENIKDAVAHAQEGARAGKILVAPNGLNALSRTG
jgi:mitochondrial enoyl-[acyl-carrier protein] reductase / trans-2-enoyl-CoA reductase